VALRGLEAETFIIRQFRSFPFVLLVCQDDTTWEESHMDRLIQNLADLGLHSDEAAAYLALLGRCVLTPTELASQAELNGSQASEILESLTAKGLCVRPESSRQSYVAVDPTRALESLGRHRVAELERARHRTVQHVAALVAELAPVFRAGRNGHDAMASIEIFGDSNCLAALTRALALATRAQAKACIRRPLLLTRGENWRFMRGLLERGITYRAVYEQTALEDAELHGWMVNFKELGQEIRVVRHVPLKMVSFDDAAVILALQDPLDGATNSTALVRDRGIIAMLLLAFERLWDEGTPFDG
jgi:hypothetical protein